ncbi:hypothetical protein chiPu_0014057 [Chiloscyllium punctatum]|uniref:Uncharacterized protein n=2 Tax=Chiloscyllium punctatum TaxID=137246 RepID=A0A401SYT8_CHIPU|nr:hypothetical protein [Chiloscyllium punctatum]
MFKRFKRRGSPVSRGRQPSVTARPELTARRYCRPHFLHQNPAEMSQCGDQSVRPVLLPPRNKKLPCNTGYAE